MPPTLGAISLVRSPRAVTRRHSNTEGKTPAEPDNDPEPPTVVENAISRSCVRADRPATHHANDCPPTSNDSRLEFVPLLLNPFLIPAAPTEPVNLTR
jgi:hypothetical protein